MDAVLYFRTALLVASSISAHLAFTAPTTAPPAEEQAKYKAAASVGESGFTFVHACFTIKHIIHTTNFIDFICLLSSFEYRIPYKLPPVLSVQLDTNRIPPAILLGTLVMCIGSSIRVMSFRELGRYFTFQLAIKKDHKLVTSGPYSIVRHPSYLGAIIGMSGIVLSLLGPGSVYAELGFWTNPIMSVAGLVMSLLMSFIVLGIALRVSKEDLALKAEFGKDWEAWARRTPHKLVPGIY